MTAQTVAGFSFQEILPGSAPVSVEVTGAFDDSQWHDPGTSFTDATATVLTINHGVLRKRSTSATAFVQDLIGVRCE